MDTITFPEVNGYKQNLSSMYKTEHLGRYKISISRRNINERNEVIKSGQILTIDWYKSDESGKKNSEGPLARVSTFPPLVIEYRLVSTNRAPVGQWCSKYPPPRCTPLP